MFKQLIKLAFLALGLGLVITHTSADTVEKVYNPNTGENFLTSNISEADQLLANGYQFQNTSWALPSGATTQKVLRLYNPNTTYHYYTTSSYEASSLVKAGWQNEGLAFYGAVNKGVPVFKDYNPNTGYHNYTTSWYEHIQLMNVGWQGQGVAFYEYNYTDVGRDASALTPYLGTWNGSGQCTTTSSLWLTLQSDYFYDYSDADGAVPAPYNGDLMTAWDIYQSVDWGKMGYLNIGLVTDPSQVRSGDIFFIIPNTPGYGYAGHTGVVTSVVGGGVQTYESNMYTDGNGSVINSFDSRNGVGSWYLASPYSGFYVVRKP